MPKRKEPGTLYEIRVESAGMSLNLRTGEFDVSAGTRIKYRRKGSKGRFTSFVVVGEVPQDLQKLVQAYIEKSAAEMM